MKINICLSPRLLLLTVGLATAFTGFLAAQPKPRLLILTDIGGDPDDQQSLVRLLVHANAFDLEGFCATSRLEHGQDTRPELLREQIEAYRQVYVNLRQHATGYPQPDSLLNLIKNGEANQQFIGENRDSEASEWIIRQVDKPDPRPLWVSVWGGQRELAQALWKVSHTRSEPETEVFVRKLRVHAVGNQDGHMRWIVENFPSIFFIMDGFVNYGYPEAPKVRELSAYRGMYMTGNEALGNRQWVDEYVIGHGPLSAQYPPDAHGKPGMKEGDSPAFMGLVLNGLHDPEQPETGGFGGRYRRWKGNLFVDALDFGDGQWNERYTVSRWRPYFQADFAAHLDWCVRPYAQANHHPRAVVNGDTTQRWLTVKAAAGSKVRLSAEASSDPDGQTLHYQWFHYWEAGNYPGRVEIQGSEKAFCTVLVPKDGKDARFHIILAVTDSGSPALTRFRRIVIEAE